MNTHSWESNGFNAPYQCVGMYSLPSPYLQEVNPLAFQSMILHTPKGFSLGYCSICNHPLIHHFLMTDKNGKKFSVGCDCVEKSGDLGLIKEVNQLKRTDAENKSIAAKAAATRAKHDAERAINGGMTNAELALHNKEEAKNLFYNEHKELFDAVKLADNEFALTVLLTVIEYRNMSDSQKLLLENAVESHTFITSPNNIFVGNIGDALTMELTCKKIIAIDGHYGRTYMCILRNAIGQYFKYSGSAISNIPDINETANLKFKISGHENYLEINQTRIQRVKFV